MAVLLFFFCSTATFLFERFTATYCSNFRFIDVKLNSLTSSYAVHGSGWFMELDDSEMSRWCLETARKGDVSDVMKTLEALLLRTCGQDRLTLSSWTRQSAKLRDKKKFLVKRLLDLLCKQMLQFHSSYISYKQYVDTHISWLASLSLWALPGMAAHRATVSEKKGAKSVYASFVVSIRSWKTISIHFIHCIYLLKHVGGIKRHSKQKLQKPMEICTCCPTLRHASWQSCTVGASTVPVWHIHGMHKHSWWGTVFRGFTVRWRAKLQWWSVEELMDWMMNEVKKWSFKIKDVGSCDEWNMLKWKESIFV